MEEGASPVQGCKRKVTAAEEATPVFEVGASSASSCVSTGEKHVLIELFGLREAAEVLIVGDGNLSFAKALADLNSGARIVGTTFEEHDKFTNLFARDIRTDLRASGVTVVHGVDGTNLAGTLSADIRRPFDCIIFQFPQHPERRKINKNRELMRDFFQSAVTQLAPKGEIVVSLCKGQGGTPAEPSRKATDTWQVQDAAANSGLLLRRIEQCPVEALGALGYNRTGLRVQGMREATSQIFQDRPFKADGSLTYTFCRDSEGATAAFPLEWHHDISFWTLEGFCEVTFKKLIQDACGPRCEPLLTLLDQYCRPDDGRTARTYRIAIRTDLRAISERTWKNLCEEFRESGSAAGIIPRSQDKALEINTDSHK